MDLILVERGNSQIGCVPKLQRMLCVWFVVERLHLPRFSCCDLLDRVDGRPPNACKYDVGVGKLMFLLIVMQRELVDVLVQVM